MVLGVCASLLAPGFAEAAAGAVPVLRARREAKSPEFNQAPTNDDLASLVLHLGDTIADKTKPQDRVPGVDFFLENLEESLREGNDLPRDNIVRNASSARESLRRAYNDLATAGAPPLLTEVAKKLKEAADALVPLIARNQDQVRELEFVAVAARATVNAMTLRPPGSPGALVPLGRLNAIVPLKPEIQPIRDDLKKLVKQLAMAKKYVERARKSAASANARAERAGALDEEALKSLGQRRTRGIPTEYKTQMKSKKILMNANRYVVRAVEGADKTIGEFSRQLDPKNQEGLRWAVDRLLEADALAQQSRELQRRSGKRINFNHEVRLNKYIYNGWEVTRGTRREAWWLGRSNMAISEAQVDADKIEEAYRRAEAFSRRADEAARTGVASVKAVERSLGRFRDKPPLISYRELDVPAVKRARVERRQRKTPEVKSKRLKVPKTFDVPMDEIVGSYDGTWGR
ncbi:MAG: hypothetical protein CO113_16110 [Elusimicrobia bacterium CG_4_9_14_3_um_filter_62_55]|nr:MAG: hypothetical protein COR54_06275 [Elusimicrobia bacterium CG22_combo_CG10-13_8_21_14_all_63_91]PJA12724.1 MAG: hypothetical protein COX66_16790 [Elusimicrobia bacterium CG_4_10_14_0_2_um_filter_63_34]PJB24023.1 MAG: hypothetical protein CO113_16110 [Elusimicrobia bacterium CG_4_9_14_3_um_filter_62_55]